MRRVWLAACWVGMSAWVACAQTPASQANTPQWQQTPEGRPTVPQTPMNCSGTATRGDDGKVTTTSNCPAAQDKPVPSNAAQQFPYPGDAQAPPKQQQTPNAPGAQQAPKSAAQQFPYPGDSQGSSSSSSDSGDVKPAPPGGLQDAGSSGASSGSSSSSSGSGYSSSNADQPPAAPDEDTEGVPTRTRASRKRPAEPVKTNSQRFDEDLQVASLYQNDGNFMGAYLRAKDAVTIAGDNPDARLALAEAARKLGKLDEAEQNYKKCLELDPVPKTRKAAQAALKQMTGG